MERLKKCRFVKPNLIIAATSCFLSGCLPESDNPVAGSATAKVDPKPYIAKNWRLSEAPKKNARPRTEYMTIYENQNALKVSFDSSMKDRPLELRLTRVANRVIASLQRFRVDENPNPGWDIFRVTLKDKGSKMVVEPLKEDVVREHIKKKILKGEIHDTSWFTRTKSEMASIQATGNELRQYVKTRAVFGEKIEFVKVARRS